MARRMVIGTKETTKVDVCRKIESAAQTRKNKAAPINGPASPKGHSPFFLSYFLLNIRFNEKCIVNYTLRKADFPIPGPRPVFHFDRPRDRFKEMHKTLVAGPFQFVTIGG